MEHLPGYLIEALVNHFHGDERRIGLAPDSVRKVCNIIARHHSPPKRPTPEFLLLHESDWLVNVRDSPERLGDPPRLEAAIQRVFRTPAGATRAKRLLLGEQPLFQRMGAVYKLLVDEGARRRKEAPFLLEIAEQARRIRGGRKRPKSATPVLDLGCGTGFHSRLLARAGYPVTAVDYSPAVLAEARRFRCPGRITYREGDLLQPIRVKMPAALTLLLGNTLSVFETPKDLRKVLRHAAEATREGGLVLCQILNYERLRARGGGAVARHGRVAGRETVLTKSLQPTDDGRILLTLTASQREEEGKWESIATSSPLTPLAPKDLVARAKRAGLCKETEWGDLQGSAFDPKASTDYVALFLRGGI
ncbi:MAG TPA: class I SAM-dependent methyltransferase [Sumerlaeia bacterium]|nr:class I SAM-dependent methyltransferase [Sumerlaeia bacterium]